MLSSRIGRPKSDNPKCIDIKVRIDNEVNEKLLVYCKKHNITRAEAIRRGIKTILDK